MFNTENCLYFILLFLLHHFYALVVNYAYYILFIHTTWHNRYTYTCIHVFTWTVTFVLHQCILLCESCNCIVLYLILCEGHPLKSNLLLAENVMETHVQIILIFKNIMIINIPYALVMLHVVRNACSLNNQILKGINIENFLQCNNLNENYFCLLFCNGMLWKWTANILTIWIIPHSLWYKFTL